MTVQLAVAFGIGRLSQQVGLIGWVAWVCILIAGIATLGASSALLPLVIAPWVEEILLRRGLHDSLRHRVSPAAAMAISAFAFGLAHVIVVVAGTGPAHPGAVLAAAATVLPAWLIGHHYQRHACLIACVAAHAGANLLWLVVVR